LGKLDGLELKFGGVGLMSVRHSLLDILTETQLTVRPTVAISNLKVAGSREHMFLHKRFLSHRSDSFKILGAVVIPIGLS